jgi:hypothetical protein
MSASVPAISQLHLNANFNAGDPTNGSTITRHTSGLGNYDSAMILVTTPSKSGYAIASILPSNDSSGAFYPRAELRIDKPGADSSVSDDYFGFDANFDNWLVDPRDGLIFQAKQYDPTFPSIGLWFRKIGTKSYLTLVRQADTLFADRQLGNPSPLTGQMQDEYVLMEVPIYTWTRFDFKCNWQDNYTGWIQVYINRVLVYTLTGPNLNKTFSSVNKKKPPLRLGVYWFGAKSQPITPAVVVRRVYFDNITVGRVGEITWDDYLNFYAPVISLPPTETRYILTNYQAVKAL